ncbi:MAG TPA: glycosyltransferase, partial [Bacteroidia bacterium]|nr:glycosyltransferase [Bacteroidia bacterium]
TIGHYLSIAIKKYTDKNPIIISNWANSDFVKPTDKKTNRFAIQYKLTDKFTVMYSGNWGLTHNLEAIVLTAEKLKHNSFIQFVIIGDGAKRSMIELMIKEKKLTNILLLPYQDKKILPASLSSADVAVISLSEGAEHVSVPSKTYSSLSAGSVILALASEKSELGLLVKQYNCGAIFTGFNINEIAQFIEALSTNSNQTDEFKKNARIAAQSFTPENAKLYYNEIHKS